MPGLPGVIAAKGLAQGQLEEVGGSRSTSVSSLFLLHAETASRSFPSSGISVAWCSEEVMPVCPVSLSLSHAEFRGDL